MLKVVCAKCGLPPDDPSEVEPTLDGKWMHQRCMGTGYSLNFVDWIKTRIAVSRTDEDEDRYKFVVRELVQNADDVKAQILVLRFEKDALYVANDGRAFSTVGPDGGYEGSDFDRSSRVLKRFKQFDKESTGHFGSGFQTVYTITNHPEVHSNAACRALNPLNQDWDDNLERRLRSPYAGGPVGRKGVLFRLPWRDDKAAQEVVNKERPFAVRDFPRWNPEDIRQFYDGLKGYLADVLLFCQWLKAVRIVWCGQSRREAFQAERDYELHDPLPKARVVEIGQGLAKKGATWYDWDPSEPVRDGTCPSSFDLQAWEYQSEEKRRYLAASGIINDKDGRRLMLLLGPRGSIKTDHTKSPKEDEIKKNHIHIMFPLFPAKRAYLCSVIPLPSRGRNHFAFSAHLVPIESRTGVDVQGNDGVNGEWYHAAMLSLVSLYRDSFPLFLEAVRQTRVTPSESQLLVLQSLPRGEVREWMQTGGGDVLWGTAETEGLKDWIFRQPILVTGDGAWRPPAEAFHVADEVERKVVEALRKTAMPPYYTSKLKDIPWLEGKSGEEKFTPADFTEAWDALRTEEPLRYGKSVGGPQGMCLDRSTIEAVLRYALASNMGDQLSKLPIVPDASGEFRDLGSFPKLPLELREMASILSTRRRIHPDFAALVDELESARSRRREAAFTEVPQMIDTEFKEQQVRFKAMSEEDHRLVSRMVFKVVSQASWAIDKGLGKFFVPCDYGGVKSLGQPPDVQDWPEHEGEHYTREWTFASQSVPVPGLTPEVRRRIRILDLKGVSEEDERRVSKRLSLVALAEKTGPTNFVRTFISPRLGSLFEDRNLAEFIGTSNPEALERQKKAMLGAIRAYFDKPHVEAGMKPDDMGKVPCLYGTDGVWRPARKFARGGGPILERLDLHPLHEDFASKEEWPDDTLKALQVTVKLDEVSVVEIIKAMATERHPDRKLLANLLGTMLLEFDSKQLSAVAAGLKETPWVPTGITDVVNPGEAMYPSLERKSILGESHRRFVELDLMDFNLREKVEALGGDASNKAFALGLHTKPSLDEMSDVFRSCIGSGRPPPKSLQVELSKALPGTEREREEWKRGIAAPALYWDGEWHEGSRIRILTKREGFPVPFESVGLLVLSPDEVQSVRELADAVGAKTVVQIVDLVRAIVYISEKVKGASSSWQSWEPRYRALWRWLENHQAEIPEGAGEEAARERIVFAAGSWFAPRDVVLDDMGLAEAPVNLGQWSVITASSEFASAMVRLGVRKVSQLSEETVLRLLGTLKVGTTLEPQRAAIVLGLLALADGKGWTGRMDAVPWPTSTSRTITLQDPGDVFVGNQSLVTLFPSVPQALTGVNGRQNPALKSLVERWEAKSMDERVSYPDSPFQPGARAPEIEAVLGEVYAGGITFNPSDWGALSCMHGLEVWRVGKTIQRYSLDSSEGRFTVPALVPAGRGHVALLVTKELESLDRTTAEALVAWAIGEGLDPQKREMMTKALVESCQERREALEYDVVAQRQRPGYPETLERLSSWYPGCQLCGDVTPKDDRGIETAENIRSMILSRGGLFRGKSDAYEPANSLYLCPRHAILLDRGLVKLGFMKGWETNKERVLQSLRDVEGRIPEDGSMLQVDVDVFEWTWKSEAKEISFDNRMNWKTRTLKLTPDHAKMVFDRLISYVRAGQ